MIIYLRKNLDSSFSLFSSSPRRIHLLTEQEKTMAARPKPSENLFSHIRGALPTYSRAFKQLASYILAQAFAASSMSIEELAQAAGVSVATVNRFAHACGYDGYPQFKAALRNLFDRIFEPIEKARTPQKNGQDVISQSFSNAIQNLQHTQATLDENALYRAADMILSSANIYVAGMGVSALHASFLVDALEPFLTKNHIKELAGLCGAERAFRRVAMFSPEDLLIAITLPRYSQSIIDLASLARKQKCKILSLTDQPSSPLIPFSDETLLASSNHPVLYATNVSMIALIEVLTMAITRRIDNFAQCIAKQTETVLPYFYISRPEIQNKNTQT